MLRLFRNYSPFTVLILFISAFIMKLQALSHPVAPVALPDHIFFATILSIFNVILKGSAFGYTLLTVVILFLQALYINYISVRHKLFTRNTYLPAFSYVLLTSINPALNYFSEPLLINTFVLLAVNLLLTLSQTSQPRKQIFNTGFIICLPVLLQLPAAGFFLLLILGLVFLRSFNVGEWVVAIMGFLTPVYFFAAILFLTDHLSVLKNVFHLGFSVPRHLSHPVYVVGTMSGLAILLIIGCISLQQQINKLLIYIRRSWGVLYAYLFVSAGVALIALSMVNAEWLIIMPALSLLITHAFHFEKSKWFSNFTFYFSLALLIFSQFALNK